MTNCCPIIRPTMNSKSFSVMNKTLMIWNMQLPPLPSGIWWQTSRSICRLPCCYDHQAHKARIPGQIDDTYWRDALQHKDMDEKKFVWTFDISTSIGSVLVYLASQYLALASQKLVSQTNSDRGQWWCRLRCREDKRPINCLESRNRSREKLLGKCMTWLRWSQGRQFEVMVWHSLNHSCPDTALSQKICIEFENSDLFSLL